MQDLIKRLQEARDEARGHPTHTAFVGVTDLEEAIKHLKELLWVPTAECLPANETPVEILFHDGTVRIGELCWEHPSFEETFKAFQYWDDPNDDGQDWGWEDITHWRAIPANRPPETTDAEWLAKAEAARSGGFASLEETKLLLKDLD